MMRLLTSLLGLTDGLEQEPSLKGLDGDLGQVIGLNLARSSRHGVLSDGRWAEVGRARRIRVVGLSV